MRTEPRNVEVHAQVGNGAKATLNDFPDECSICHHKVIPQFLIAAFNVGTDKLQATYQCTNHACLKLMIATYERNKSGYYDLKQVEPIIPSPTTFSKEILETSPVFVQIYNQAIVAESIGLDQVVGIALRKAIEFLVKDYAILKNPSHKDEIGGLQLANCIEKYIHDTNISGCVKRATWLANDETHYIRKWEGKDIKDLKSLIRISVNGLENLLLTTKYLEEMPG